CKFSTEGVIRLTARREPGDPEWMVFSVRDQGIGMSPEQIEKVFQPFTQADASTSRRYGGTGLGLTITQKFCQLMGGDVNVTSASGQGSTFTIRLPREISSAQSLAESSVFGDPAETPGPLDDQHAFSEISGSSRACDVLLAEDNLFNQRLAFRLLERMGHAVTLASNGKEAVAIMEDRAFDFILMDVQMPEMDGFEATAVIRKRESRTGGRVPIIAMTAHAMVGDRDRCIKAGMDDYVSKPIRFDQLHAVVERTLDAESRPPEEDASEAGTLSDNEDDDAATVSLDRFREMAQGDDEFMVELMHDFMTDVSSNLAGLEAAVGKNDRETARRCAHSIKGLSASVDAESLRQLAVLVENAAAADDMATVETQRPELRRQAEIACQVLKEFLDSASNQPS
ncbi:MAG: response regulator, partial [Planctomycetales bacterium]